MSIDCEGCGETICAPDSIWYAATMHSYTVNYICGTCVSLIPFEARTSVTDLQPYAITFGHLNAEIGSHGWYQCMGARQDRVVFCTTTAAICENIPYAQPFLDDLYPFYCIDDYLKAIVAAYTTARHTNPGAWQQLMQDIQKYGFAIAEWLHIPHAATFDSPEFKEQGFQSLYSWKKLSTGEMKAVIRVLLKRYRL